MIETFGMRLQKLREKENISQEEFADMLDVSRQSISKWENDKAYPELNRLNYIADYFDVSLDYLVNGNGENKKESIKNKNFKELYKDIDKQIVSFISNLSKKKKIKFFIFFILALIIFFQLCYFAGFGIGYFLGKL